MITLVYSKRVSVRNNLLHSVCTILKFLSSSTVVQWCDKEQLCKSSQHYSKKKSLLFFFPGIKLNLELLTPSARIKLLLKSGSSFSSQKFTIVSQNNWLTILTGFVKNGLKTRDQAKSNGSHQRLSISARILQMILF